MSINNKKAVFICEYINGLDILPFLSYWKLVYNIVTDKFVTVQFISIHSINQPGKMTAQTSFLGCHAPSCPSVEISIISLIMKVCIVTMQLIFQASMPLSLNWQLWCISFFTVNHDGHVICYIIPSLLLKSFLHHIVKRHVQLLRIIVFAQMCIQ